MEGGSKAIGFASHLKMSTGVSMPEKKVFVIRFKKSNGTVPGN